MTEIEEKLDRQSGFVDSQHEMGRLVMNLSDEFLHHRHESFLAYEQHKQNYKRHRIQN